MIIEVFSNFNDSMIQTLLVPGLDFSLVVKHFPVLASLHLHASGIALALCGVTSLFVGLE